MRRPSFTRHLFAVTTGLALAGRGVADVKLDAGALDPGQALQDEAALTADPGLVVVVGAPRRWGGWTC